MSQRENKLRLGVLPSLDEMAEITDDMRRAGAAILDDYSDSLGPEQLAAAVYIAMRKHERIECKVTDFAGVKTVELFPPYDTVWIADECI